MCLHTALLALSLVSLHLSPADYFCQVKIITPPGPWNCPCCSTLLVRRAPLCSHSLRVILQSPQVPPRVPLMGQHPCSGEHRHRMPFWICWSVCLLPVPSDPELLVDRDLWFAFTGSIPGLETQVAEPERCRGGQKTEYRSKCHLYVSPSCSHSLCCLSYLPTTSEITAWWYLGRLLSKGTV